MAGAENEPSPAQLEMELKKHQAEQHTRRIEAWLSALKAIGVALVGTVIVGVTTAWINRDIRVYELQLEEAKTNREIAIKEREQEQSYLENFVSHALNEKLQDRVDFAQYVANVTTNPKMQGLWKTYHGLLEEEMVDSRADLLRIREDQQALLSSEKAKSAEYQAKIQALEDEKERIESRISSNSHRLDFASAAFDLSLDEGMLSIVLSDFTVAAAQRPVSSFFQNCKVNIRIEIYKKCRFELDFGNLVELAVSVNEDRILVTGVWFSNFNQEYGILSGDIVMRIDEIANEDVNAFKLDFNNT